MNAKELLSEIKVYPNVYTNQHASKLLNIYTAIKSMKTEIVDSSIVERIEKYPFGKRTEIKTNYQGERTTFNLFQGEEVVADQFLVQTKNGEYTFVCPVNCELYFMFCFILGIDTTKESKDFSEVITFSPDLIIKLKKAIKYAKGPKEITSMNNDHISIKIENGFAEVCATDFHKLYLSGKLECSGKDQQILINPRSFAKIKSIKEKDFKLPVDFSIFKDGAGTFAEFCGIEIELTIGEYANYTAIIPDYTDKMVFNQMDVYNSVMLVKKSANKASEKIHFHLNGRIDISACDEDFGTESISVVNYESKSFPDMDIAFNASLFLSVIETFRSDNIEMYSDGNNSKVSVFKCENTTDIALLIPVKLDEQKQQDNPYTEPKEAIKPEVVEQDCEPTPLKKKTLKEAWEMTRTEFYQDTENVIFNGSVEIVNEKPVYTYKTTVNGTTFEIIGRFMLGGYSMSDKLHKKAVQWALSEGLDVPENVMKDYPELVKIVKPWRNIDRLKGLISQIPEQLNDEKLQQLKVDLLTFFWMYHNEDLKALFEGGFIKQLACQSTCKSDFKPTDLWLQSNLNTAIERVDDEIKKRSTPKLSKLDKLKQKLSDLEDKLYNTKIENHEKLRNNYQSGAGYRSMVASTCKKEDAIQERIEILKAKIEEMEPINHFQESIENQNTPVLSDLSNDLNIYSSIVPEVMVNGQETKETRQIRHVTTQSKHRIVLIHVKCVISPHTPRREKSHPVFDPEYFDSC